MTSTVRPQRVGHANQVIRSGHYSIAAAGGTAYFCVMTVQRGDAPPVAVSGDGLDATVTVGGRTVRFDGERIVFGTPPAE